VNFEDRDSAGFADVDFHGQAVSHGSASIHFLWVGMAVGHAARHYTLAGWEHKGNRSRSLQAELAEDRRARCIRKTNHGNENFRL
jgi:hypothetical protein